MTVVPAAATHLTIGVVIGIPEPYAGELQRWRKEFGDPLAGSIPTHVTLLPPTAVSERQLPEVEAHLREVARQHGPFSLHLRGTSTFRPVSPVVFIALARGIGECELLQEAVRSGPLDRELRFPYHPHVTVAHDVPDEALDRAFTELASYDAQVPVWSFSLYRHGADGVWRPLRDFVLGGG